MKDVYFFIFMVGIVCVAVNSDKFAGNLQRVSLLFDEMSRRTLEKEKEHQHIDKGHGQEEQYPELKENSAFNSPDTHENGNVVSSCSFSPGLSEIEVTVTVS